MLLLKFLKVKFINKACLCVNFIKLGEIGLLCFESVVTLNFFGFAIKFCFCH